MTKYVVLVAGGSGSRMNSKLPKQFIEIGGLPILIHSINAFRAYWAGIQIILVLPQTDMAYWETLCQKHQLNTQNITVVAGGHTRFHSCQNGIAAIKDPNSLVAIHDAVRPFVSTQILAQGFEIAHSQGTAVCGVKAYESVRYTDTGGSTKALNRDQVYLVQTPQIFKKEILEKAYKQPYSDVFTDDASVVEQAGYAINMYEGSRNNIKITTPTDLALAEILLKNDN
jgi:2-C-methyl-D-erythritol 4-phosphate cytidylyltransferase